MTTVTIREALGDLWADMSGAQKWVLIALVLGCVAAIIGSWANTFQAWQEIRVYERQAVKAEQEKNEALEKAAKIASSIRVKEEELFKVEVKRDEKVAEVKRAGDIVARDRADYDRAVRERVPSVPSSDELCASLKSLGYPCK